MTATLALNDGHRIPAIGLGTWPMQEEAPGAVSAALQMGYRLVDTAAKYENEAAVGRGIAESGLAREQLTVTTKVRGRDQGYEATLRAFEASRTALGLEYVDLYLIHWPLPRLDLYLDTWRAMIRLRDEGVVRSIGVSNFSAAHLERLIAASDVVPAVNQIELHPYLPQAGLRAEHERLGIATQSWSPLGRKSDMLTDPTLAQIAGRHGVQIAQVVLRWHVQLGTVPIPKSASPERQRTNLDVFGFELSDSEMAQITALERGRLGHDPEVHEEF